MNMRKTGYILLGLIILLAPGRLFFAQDKVVLTLEKSLELALTQNPYHLASEERVDAAKQQVREAAAGFLPSLNSTGLATLDEKLFELEFPSMIPGRPPEKVKVDFTRDYQIGLSLSIPIYTGGRLTAGYKSAKYNLRSTQESVRQSEHVTVFNTKAVFYGCLLGQEFIRVAEQAVKDAEDLHKSVKSQYEVGLASQFDLLRSEVRVVNLKPQLIQAKNNFEVMKLNLKTLLGMDLSTPIEIQGNLSYEPIEPDMEKSIGLAIQNRPEILQLEYQKRIAEEMWKMARAERLPTLAISGSFNFWADRLALAGDIWQDYYNINLVLTVPIFNGFGPAARQAQAKTAVREIELNLKGLKDGVRFEVSQAILKIEEARESLLSQEKNVEQAEESLRIANLNYNEGMITVLDVSSAQTALNQARVNYSQAVYDFFVAVADFERSLGVKKNEIDKDILMKQKQDASCGGIK
jgi:outer membrane protein TolC